MTTPQRPQDPCRHGAGEHPAQPDPHPQQPWQYGRPVNQLPPPFGPPARPVPGRSAFPGILVAVLLAVVVALGVFLFVQAEKRDLTAARSDRA